MKNFFYTISFVLVFVNLSSAQTEKGTWLLGGNAGFVKPSGAPGQLSVTPAVGYFLLDHFAAGGQVNFLVTKNVSTNKLVSFFSLGPFGRYYFLGDDRGRLYVSGGLNIGGGTGSKFDTGYNIGAGYAVFLNESISVDLGMHYDKIGSSRGVFALGAGFQVHFNRLRNSRIE
jgi:hypothetical protein